MRWDPDNALCRIDGGLLHLAARDWQATVPLAALRRVLVLHKHGTLPTAEAERAFVFETDEAVHLVPETSGVEALLPALEQDPPRLYEAHYATSPLSFGALRWNAALARGRGGSFPPRTLQQVLSQAELRGPLRPRLPSARLERQAGHG